MRVSTRNTLPTLLMFLAAFAATPSARALQLDTFGDWSAFGAPGSNGFQDNVDAQSKALGYHAENTGFSLASGLRPHDRLSVRLGGNDPIEAEPVSNSPEFPYPATPIAPNYILTVAHAWTGTFGSGDHKQDVLSLPRIRRRVYVGRGGGHAFNVVDGRAHRSPGVGSGAFKDPATGYGPQDLMVLRVDPASGTSGLNDWARLPQNADALGSMVALGARGPHRHRFLTDKTAVGQSSLAIADFSHGQGRLAWGSNVLEPTNLATLLDDQVRFHHNEPTHPGYLWNDPSSAFYDPTVNTLSSLETRLLEGDSGSSFLRREGLSWDLQGVLGAGWAALSESDSEGVPLSTWARDDLTLPENHAWIDAAIASMGGISYDTNGDGVNETGLTLNDLPSTTAMDTVNTWNPPNPSAPNSWFMGNHWTNGLPDAQQILRVDGGRTSEIGFSSSLAIGKHLVVGWDGPGVAKVRQGFGPDASFTDVVMLGYQSGSRGEYELLDGELSSATMYVGYDGEGAFTQTGGSNVVRDTLYVGRFAAPSGPQGRYELDAPSASNDDLRVHARRIVVGALGEGEFEHKQGRVSAMRVTIGHGVGGVGTYTQTGGELLVSERLQVGLDGVGELALQDAAVEIGYEMNVSAGSTLRINPGQNGSDPSTITVTGGSDYVSRLSIDGDANVVGANEHLHLVLKAEEGSTDNKMIALDTNDHRVERVVLGGSASGSTVSLQMESNLYVDNLEILQGFQSGLGSYGTAGTNEAGLFHDIDGDGCYVRLIPGDANLDGKVDPADAAIIGMNWMSAGGWLEGDFNGDGMVDPADNAILGGPNWLADSTPRPLPTSTHACPPGGSSVPEPSTFAVVLTALLQAGLWRGRVAHR